MYLPVAAEPLSKIESFVSKLQMQTDLTLRLPRRDEEKEFMRAHRATSPEVPDFLHYYKEGMPFSRYLEVLAERRSSASSCLSFCSAIFAAVTSVTAPINSTLPDSSLAA